MSSSCVNACWNTQSTHVAIPEFQMHDEGNLGLLAVQAVSVIAMACLVVGALTNRRFGHPTFFRDSPKSRKQPGRKGVPWTNTCSPSREDIRKATQHEDVRQINPSDGSTTGQRCRKREDLRFDLPEGVLGHVLSFLFPGDLTRVACVSSGFLQASNAEPLWKEHCVRCFCTDRAFVGEAWRKAYQHLHLHRTDLNSAIVSGARAPHTTASEDATCMRGRFVERWRSQLPLLQSVLYVRSIFTALAPSSNCSEVTRDRASTVATRIVKRASAGKRDGCANSVRHIDASWRDAFFNAHRDHPRELLDAALPSSCVVVVAGKVHDLTEFLDSHPGGALILREYASTDATEAFERFYHSRKARKIAETFVVWDGAAVMGRKGTLSRYSNQWKGG